MDNLILHIEYLLLHNDCVIVPGLGAFIRMKFPASIDYESGKITPMWSEVRFNQSVSHDDGMLTASFARKYRLAFAEAREMVTDAIAQLKNALIQDGEVAAGRLGILRMGEEKNISFHPLQSASALNAQLGLTSVKINKPAPGVKASEQHCIEKPGKNHSDDSYHITIPKTAAKIAASLFLILFTALVLLIPTDTADRMEHRASMVPLTTASLPSDSTAPCKEDKSGEEAETTLQPCTPHPAIQPASYNELYYLIVATFTSEDDADRFISSNQSGPYTLTKVKAGKKCRVSAKSADNSKELYQLLNSQDFQNHFREAWVWHE